MQCRRRIDADCFKYRVRYVFNEHEMHAQVYRHKTMSENEKKTGQYM